MELFEALLLALAVAALIVPETRGLTSQQLEDIYKEVSKKYHHFVLINAMCGVSIKCPQIG